MDEGARPPVHVPYQPDVLVAGEYPGRARRPAMPECRPALHMSAIRRRAVLRFV